MAASTPNTSKRRSCPHSFRTVPGFTSDRLFREDARMKIKYRDTVAGVPIMQVRDFLRKEPHDAWSLDYVSHALELSPAAAQDVVQEVEANGHLVSKSGRRGAKPIFAFTTIMSGLAGASPSTFSW